MEQVLQAVQVVQQPAQAVQVAQQAKQPAQQQEEQTRQAVQVTQQLVQAPQTVEVAPQPAQHAQAAQVASQSLGPEPAQHTQAVQVAPQPLAPHPAQQALQAVQVAPQPEQAVRAVQLAQQPIAQQPAQLVKQALPAFQSNQHASQAPAQQVLQAGQVAQPLQAPEQLAVPGVPGQHSHTMKPQPQPGTLFSYGFSDPCARKVKQAPVEIPGMLGGLTADNLEKLGWAKNQDSRAGAGSVGAKETRVAEDQETAQSSAATENDEKGYSYGAAFCFLDRLRKNKTRLSKLTPETLGRIRPWCLCVSTCSNSSCMNVCAT